MSLLRALRIVFASTLVGTAIGSAVGFSLATWNPGYYRACFPAVEKGNVTPLEVGLGLGISQGTVAGTLVGAVLVFALAVAHVRQNPSTPPADDEET